MIARDAFVDGPVVSLASPWLRMVVGRGVARELADLRRDNSLLALPIEDVNTLSMLVAEGHAATQELAPAEPGPARASRRIDGSARAVATMGTMTTAEVATTLGVTAGRVRQLDKSGELPATRDHRGWLQFDPAAVEAFVDRRGTRPA